MRSNGPPRDGMTSAGTPRGRVASAASLRDRRLEFGLTQAELAERAGVSRQLIAAVEAGRHAPAVDAALRLAASLATTVEELFGHRPPEAVAALGGRLIDGCRVRIGRVGERLVAAELPDHGVAGVSWAAPDGVWSAGGPHLFGAANPDALVVAGCEPAFGIAEELSAGRAGRRLMSISAPTGVALDALDDRRIHAAVVHGPPTKLPRAPRPVQRVHVARWQVGLAVPPRLRGGLESILGKSRLVIQREAAASIQQAFLRAVRAAGLAPPANHTVARGHLDAARLGSVLRAPAVTNEPAAEAFGLRFLPLEEHVVEVWIGQEWLGHSGARVLGDVLASRAFTERVAGYGGYDLAGCGAVAPAP